MFFKFSTSLLMLCTFALGSCVTPNAKDEAYCDKPIYVRPWGATTIEQSFQGPCVQQYLNATYVDYKVTYQFHSDGTTSLYLLVSLSAVNHQNCTSPALSMTFNGTYTLEPNDIFQVSGIQQSRFKAKMKLTAGNMLVINAADSNAALICGSNTLTATTYTFPNLIGATPLGCVKSFGFSEPMNLASPTSPYFHFMNGWLLHSASGIKLIEANSTYPNSYFNDLPFYRGPSFDGTLYE